MPDAPASGNGEVAQSIVRHLLDTDVNVRKNGSRLVLDMLANVIGTVNMDVTDAPAEDVVRIIAVDTQMPNQITAMI